MKYRLLTILFTLLTFAGASQPQSVTIKPVPTWVQNFPVTDSRDTANASGGFLELLIDDQYNLKARESFHHYAQKVITEKGLENISTLSISFEPSYKTLTVHSIDIVRDGRRIDQLALGTFNVLNRETNLERLVYDGSLTAVFNLHNVRVGDILEYAYSFKGSNPAFSANFSEILYFNYSVPVGKVVRRLVIEKGRQFEFKKFNKAPDPEIISEGNQSIYLWQVSNVPALLSEDATPGWYDPYDHVQFSDFMAWDKLSALTFLLYKNELDSKGLLKKIPGIVRERKEEAISRIVQFVQDEVRYLSFSSGIHGYKPHPPSVTLNQRFGDCKDKSVLLASLLRELDVPSTAVLVNTAYGQSLPDYLPSPYLFDHCIVRFEFQDSVYWVDPTISFQRGSLRNIKIPNYSNGLVLNSGGNPLVAMVGAQKTSVEVLERFILDKIGGGATLSVSTVYRGQAADNTRDYFKSRSLEEVEKNYINFYATDYPEISKAKGIAWKDDEHTNEITVREEYQISKFWKYDSASQKYTVSAYPRFLSEYLKKPSTKIRKAPYSISFPTNVIQTIRLEMPEAWNVTPVTKTIETPSFQYRSESIYADSTIDLNYSYRSKKSFVENSEIKDYTTKVDEVFDDLEFIISYTMPTTAKQQFNYPFLLILLVVMAGAIFGFMKLADLDPEPKPSPQSYSTIGGWLILPGIGLCLTPIFLVVELTNLEYFAYTNWEMVASPTSAFYDPSKGIFVLLEMLYNFLMIGYTVLLIFLFLNRRSNLPILMCAYYIISAVVMIADSYVAGFYGVEVDKETQKDIGRTIASAIIWIPYFLISDRSKGTFTVRKSQPDKQITYRVNL